MQSLRRLTFDLDVLRSFVAGMELGSFAKAADRLGRSTSAVSAQLKKLEEQVGAPVLRKSGRGLVLTATGETLLAYARRLLDLNDEAAGAVRNLNLEGGIRIGLQEEFGEHLLTKVLGDFARAHPRVQVEARVSRNVELLDLVDSGRLDLALAWESPRRTAHSEALGKLPMCWIGGPAEQAAERMAGEPLALVAFESPCLMRSAATAALDAAGIPWRVSFTSVSLSSIWAAVGAGLGVTVRTRAGLPRHLQVREDLPALPEIGLVLHRGEREQPEVVRRLAQILRESVQELLQA